MDNFNIKENEKRNNKFIKEFKKYLENKKLVPKTINKHLSNVELYLNDYLIYYKGETMEEGISSVFMFLDDWFIRKCTWSSPTSIKSTASSLKKFYKCMVDLNYVDEENYKFFFDKINDSIDIFIESYYEYMSEDDDWF